MSVASAVYERTCHVCDVVRFYVLKTIYEMQRGRQLSVNRDIMEQMRYEFTPKGDGFLYLQRMNDSTNKRYDEKIKQLSAKPIEYDGL